MFLLHGRREFQCLMRDSCDVCLSDCMYISLLSFSRGQPPVFCVEVANYIPLPSDVLRRWESKLAIDIIAVLAIIAVHVPFRLFKRQALQISSASSVCPSGCKQSIGALHGSDASGFTLTVFFFSRSPAELFATMYSCCLYFNNCLNSARCTFMPIAASPLSSVTASLFCQGLLKVALEAWLLEY